MRNRKRYHESAEPLLGEQAIDQSQEADRGFDTVKPFVINGMRSSFYSAVNYAQRNLRQLIGGFVAKKILLSLSRDFREDYNVVSLRETLQSRNLTADRFRVLSGSVELDTLEIRPIIEPAHQLHIIRFCGNRLSYTEDIHELMEQAERLQAHVIGFDYRGVNRSQKVLPTCAEDLIQDGISQVQRLIDLDVQSENILLKGISLGGAIATKVTRHFHDQGQRIYLFNDRSFSSITHVIEGWIRTFRRNGYTESFYGKVVGKIAKPLVWTGLSLSRWNINVVSDFLAIAPEYRDYLVVRTPSRFRKNMTNMVKDDSTIPHSASLYRALKTRCVSQQAGGEKNKRFVVSEDSEEKEGHRVPLSSLRCDSITGQEAFEFFARKEHRQTQSQKRLIEPVKRLKRNAHHELFEDISFK
jgi:hypothetical protein